MIEIVCCKINIDSETDFEYKNDSCAFRIILIVGGREKKV